MVGINIKPSLKQELLDLKAVESESFGGVIKRLIESHRKLKIVLAEKEKFTPTEHVKGSLEFEEPSKELKEELKTATSPEDYDKVVPKVIKALESETVQEQEKHP